MQSLSALVEEHTLSIFHWKQTKYFKPSVCSPSLPCSEQMEWGSKGCSHPPSQPSHPFFTALVNGALPFPVVLL